LEFLSCAENGVELKLSRICIANWKIYKNWSWRSLSRLLWTDATIRAFVFIYSSGYL